MSLKDKKIKSEYRFLIDNVVQDFYIPLLHESIYYKRAVKISKEIVDIVKGEAKTCEEIGRKINIIREKIRQIELRTMKKLRYPTRMKKIKDFLMVIHPTCKLL